MVCCCCCCWFLQILCLCPVCDFTAALLFYENLIVPPLQKGWKYSTLMVHNSPKVVERSFVSSLLWCSYRFAQNLHLCVYKASLNLLQLMLFCMSCWQVYHDSEEGQRYIQFYKLNKFPYISILDPRTGSSPWVVYNSVICFFGLVCSRTATA